MNPSLLASMALAVFSKNHRGYLDAATEVGKASPDQLVTFQSKKRWKSAETLIEKREPGSVAVLFAAVDSGPVVEYRARLEAVVLNPQVGNEETDRLLRLRLDLTMEEDLWSQGGGTLYAISGCHRLSREIPYSALLKASDREPLSDTFRYSYSVVVDPAEGEEAIPSPCALDIGAPPAVTQSVITRRVRDAALVRRLKVLYDHRCQRCATRLELADGSGYSEGHHLRPLGGDHAGPDTEENVVVLCPNCHALLDMAAVVIQGDTLTTKNGHTVDFAHIQYHNELARRRGAS